MTRIHYLQHVPFEGLGSIEAWAESHGHPLTRTRLYAGDPLPALEAFDWLIVMGGPMSIHDEADYPWLKVEKQFVRWCLDAGKRVLGVCLGAQLIADVLGARVYPGPQKEIGWFPIQRAPELEGHPLAEVLPAAATAFHWHGETFDLPPGARRIAFSGVCANQGFVVGNKVVALQFHLETTWDSAEQLIAHSADELVDAPTIQDAETMLGNSEGFAGLRPLMQGLLDYLAEA